jgi:hypothetical protein
VSSQSNRVCLLMSTSEGCICSHSTLSPCVGSVIGYSGGNELNPTYRRIKDHTESVLVEFDPNTISFEDVLIEVRPLSLYCLVKTDDAYEVLTP